MSNGDKFDIEVVVLDKIYNFVEDVKYTIQDL